MPVKQHKRRKAGFLSRVLLAFNIIAVIALLLCYAASFIGPDIFWPMVFFGLAYPAILLINVLFAIYWLLRINVFLFISLVAILIGWGHVESHIKLSTPENRSEHADSIKLMSFNVRYFDRYNWVYAENVKTRNEIFGMISREAPDIICFQEFYSDNSPAFNTIDILVKNYGFPYYHADYALVKSGKQSYGTATFSKYPIINRNTYRFSNNIYNFAIITDIVAKSDTFRVFNIHFQSIQLSNEDHLFINDLTRKVENHNENVHKYSRIFEKIRNASIPRASQAREIRALVESSPYPVIICTDLNDTPSSFAYRQLTKNLKDAFVESGTGLGNTYIGFLPAFRIDYILYDPFFVSHDYRTLPERLSDHYPIVTKLFY